MRHKDCFRLRSAPTQSHPFRRATVAGRAPTINSTLSPDMLGTSVASSTSEESIPIFDDDDEDEEELINMTNEIETDV